MVEDPEMMANAKKGKLRDPRKEKEPVIEVGAAVALRDMVASRGKMVRMY